MEAEPLNNNISKLSDHLFRYESGKMVSVLTKIFGTQNLELAEDVVQESFVSALQTWRLKGVPDNPKAWLYKAAKNKAIDLLRKNKFSSTIDFSDPDRKLLNSEFTLTTKMETLWSDASIEDELLKMMYACCHEDIHIENQITLILKILCGFTTTEIARAFVTAEDTISKRLYRTKEFFRIRNIKPEIPNNQQLKPKTEAVLKSIYLIFNEGYNSTQSDQIIRKDLLGQAMYLCRLLCNNIHTQLPEVYAAMALMCFHAARIDSRISPDGEIIVLSHQDRSKWDQNLISEGNEYLNKAVPATKESQTISSYHIEAAIAFQHCIAPDFERTDWNQILFYYDLLIQYHPSAIAMLNRMTVLYKIKGGEFTLDQISKSPYLIEWANHYLYHSLLGEIYTETDKAKALSSFTKAISLTKSESEKKLLTKKIQEIK